MTKKTSTSFQRPPRISLTRPRPTRGPRSTATRRKKSEVTMTWTATTPSARTRIWMARKTTSCTRMARAETNQVSAMKRTSQLESKRLPSSSKTRTGSLRTSNVATRTRSTASTIRKSPTARSTNVPLREVPRETNRPPSNRNKTLPTPSSPQRTKCKIN